MSCRKNNKELIELKSKVVDSIRTFIKGRNGIESYYNKITGGTGACEQAPTAFILQNTPEIAFMSQTDQLLMEAEIIECNIESIWTLGRSYRNEPKAGDGRHLSEFALLEYESRDMDLSQLLEFQQKLLNVAMETALDSPLISEDHRSRLERYLATPAPIISYTDILKRLNSGGVSINWGDDFSSEIEEMVCLLFDGPVQVTHYPESIKFFNMYRTDREQLQPGLSISEYNQNKYTVSCADFLLPFAGETFGGSQREELYETLNLKLRESIMFKQMIDIRSDQLKMRGENLTKEEVAKAAFKPFSAYLNLFKESNYKNLSRSGFGLGMGRLIQFLLGSTRVIVF